MGRERKKSGDSGPPPLVLFSAEFQFPFGELTDAPSSQFRDELAPLADSAGSDTEGPSSDDGPTAFGVEVLKHVLFEHALPFSILKPDMKDAKAHSVYAEEMETMADRIKMLREARGWSQVKLAELVGVTSGAVSQWESGLTENIKLKTFLKLCEALGTDTHYLIFGPERAATPAAHRTGRLHEK
jgi:DNA-binding XRE family transcriptional regulator